MGAEDRLRKRCHVFRLLLFAGNEHSPKDFGRETGLASTLRVGREVFFLAGMVGKGLVAARC